MWLARERDRCLGAYARRVRGRAHMGRGGRGCSNVKRRGEGGMYTKGRSDEVGLKKFRSHRVSGVAPTLCTVSAL